MVCDKYAKKYLWGVFVNENLIIKKNENLVVMLRVCQVMRVQKRRLKNISQYFSSKLFGVQRKNL